MEKGRKERYVESLEKTIQSNHHFLKEAVEGFREMCTKVTPGRGIPHGIILDIREAYKEIQNRLSEVKAIHQLLQGKYRQYYRRDPLRDKAFTEFGFIAKNSFSKFEYTMMQIEAQKKLGQKEQSSQAPPVPEPFQWFRSRENRVAFLRNLRILYELDYEASPESVGNERRGSQSGLRSLSLFVFVGESRLIDHLQPLMKLREHDILERYGREELRGVLAHLRKVDPLEIESLFQNFMEREGLLKLKCLLFHVRSQEDLGADLLGLMKTLLQRMEEGAVKTLGR
jgi:hypothetical protein